MVLKRGTMTHFSIASLVMMMVLSGCFYSRTYLENNLDNSVCLEVSEEEALNSPYFTKSSWVDKAWWNMFDDLQLEKLILIGLANSPTIQKATAVITKAKEQAYIERSALMPQFSGEAETNWQYLSPTGFFRSFAVTLPPVVNVIDLQINFSWELDFFGKNRKKFEAALGLMRAEEAEKALTELMLAVSIAQAYFELQQAFSEQAVLQNLANERTLYLKLTKQRRSHGLDNDIELFTAEKNLAEVERRLKSIENSIQLGTHLIKRLIGEGPNSCTRITPSQTLFSRAFPLPENLTVNLVTRRPDLMAQIWRVEAAAKQIGVAKAEFFPSLNLQGFGGLESISFPNFLNLTNKNASLNPIINIPIFTGGRLTANLEEKKAEFESAMYAYNEQLLIAGQEVADQISSFSIIQEQIQFEDALVLALKKRTAVAENRYKQGLAGSLPLISEKELLLEEELIQIDLSYRKNIAALKLIKALGGGYDGEYDRQNLRP